MRIIPSSLTIFLLPILLSFLFTLLPYLTGSLDYPTFWNLISRLSADAALILFAWNFILATRWAWVTSLYGSLAKVYVLHHVAGGIAFILMLSHPVFLAFDAITTPAGALTYFIPTFSLKAADVSLNFGIFSLYFITILLILTFYVRLPYHWWKRTHIGMGIVLVLVLIHVFYNDYLPSYHPITRYWLLTWLGVAAYAFIYRRFLYRWLAPHARYTVSDHTVHIGSSVATITLLPTSPQQTLRWEPGQFGFFQFEGMGLRKERHPFSFTTISQPSGQLSFAYKVLGDDTTKMAAHLKKGTPTTVHGPYGSFGEKFLGSKKPELWIAGGIGVTPFLSMLEHEHTHPNPQRPIHFFWSVKEKEEAFAHSHIQELCRNLSHVTYVLHVTAELGFLNLAVIQEKTALNVQGRYIFLCGPPAMMSAFEQEAYRLGVPWHNLIFELFQLYQSK